MSLSRRPTGPERTGKLTAGSQAHQLSNERTLTVSTPAPAHLLSPLLANQSVGVLAIGDWNERESNSIVPDLGGLHAILGAAKLTAHHPRGSANDVVALAAMAESAGTANASAPRARICVSVFFMIGLLLVVFSFCAC